MYQDCAKNCEGKNLIVFADTSDIILHNKKNKIKDKTGLSRLSRNRHLTYSGLILHDNLVYDIDNSLILGNSHSAYVERKPISRAKKGKKQKRCVEPIEENETYKWLKGFDESKKLLHKAKHLTLVADREADIIELLDRLPDQKTGLVIRSFHNRTVLDESGNKRKLKEVLSSSGVKACIYRLKVTIEKREKQN